MEISINIDSLKEVSVLVKVVFPLMELQSESFQFNFESSENAHMNEMKIQGI